MDCYWEVKLPPWQNRYICSDELLYFLAKVNGETILCLELPESLQETVWTQVHKDLGHLGIQRTYKLIRWQYHWKCFPKYIADFSTLCIPCQENNVKQETYPVQKSQLLRFPWDKMAINTTGPYPTSYNGKKYLITEMDLLNSYTEGYMVPYKSPESVATVLTNKLIPTHSCPITSVSDNGTEYKSKIVEEV